MERPIKLIIFDLLPNDFDLSFLVKSIFAICSLFTVILGLLVHRRILSFLKKNDGRHVDQIIAFQTIFNCFLIFVYLVVKAFGNQSIWVILRFFSQRGQNQKRVRRVHNNMEGWDVPMMCVDYAFMKKQDEGEDAGRRINNEGRRKKKDGGKKET